MGGWEHCSLSAWQRAECRRCASVSQAPPNATWAQIIAQATASSEVLRQPEVVRNVQNILATNVSVCTALGHPFIAQLNRIYLDVLSLYK